MGNADLTLQILGMEDGILEVVFLLASFFDEGDSGENSYQGAEDRNSTKTMTPTQMCSYVLIRESS